MIFRFSLRGNRNRKSHNGLGQPSRPTPLHAVVCESFETRTFLSAALSAYAESMRSIIGAEPASEITIQADGKVLLTCPTGSSISGAKGAIVRLNADGASDSTFGKGGIVKEQAFDLAVQSDGKIVGIGPGTVFRLLSNGKLDPSFGKGGIEVFDGTHAALSGKVAIDSRGRIDLYEISSRNYATNVYRFRSNGLPDLGFNGVGSRSLGSIYTFNPTSSIVVTSDGSILIGGTSYSSSPVVTSYMQVVELSSTGALSTSFGHSGVALVGEVGNQSGLFGLNPQPNGKLICSGYINGAWTLARLNMNGSIDPSFGTGGVASLYTFYSAAPAESETLPDGSILATGLASQGPVIAHYTSTGQLISNFGNHGMVTMSSLPHSVGLNCFQIETNGSVVCGGSISMNGSLFMLCTGWAPANAISTFARQQNTTASSGSFSIATKSQTLLASAALLSPASSPSSAQGRSPTEMVAALTLSQYDVESATAIQGEAIKPAAHDSNSASNKSYALTRTISPTASETHCQARSRWLAEDRSPDRLKPGTKLRV